MKIKSAMRKEEKKMKKVFAILMTMALLCVTVPGLADETPMMPGGWTVDLDQTPAMLPEADQNIFDQAALDGYTLIYTLATQVVAGTNYAFLARNDEGWAIIKVYRDLKGNVTVAGINAIDVQNILTAQEALPADLVGGWAVHGTGKPPMLPAEEAEAAYETANIAAERNLKPIALLATQLVAGTNYKVLAEENGALYVVTVYQPLTGDAAITEALPLDLLAYLAG